MKRMYGRRFLLQAFTQQTGYHDTSDEDLPFYSTHVFFCFVFELSLTFFYACSCMKLSDSKIALFSVLVTYFPFPTWL